MNFKIFMQESDAIINDMSAEALRDCIRSMARKVPEKKREWFLQFISDFRYDHVTCHDHDYEGSHKKTEHKRLITDETVRAKLSEIMDSFTKIKEGELYFSAEGYEVYSEGYCLSDWAWKYIDDQDIRSILMEAVLFAHDCMNDCRYEEAAMIFKIVMDIQVRVEDQSWDDSFELNLEEMVHEGLLPIDLKTLALEVLYTNYQLQPANNRASHLYSLFSYPYFRDIHIEDILSFGREELQETDVFFKSWIDYLMQQKGEMAARLLKEAILYDKGAEGLLEIARKGYQKHPALYLAAMLEYEKIHDYDKMKEIGKEALEKLSPDLKLRGEIALKTAQASSLVHDDTFMKKCWYEAFLSHSTVANYLRLFTDAEVTEAYKDLSEKRIAELKISGIFSNQNISEEEKNDISQMEFKYLAFFTGQIRKVQQWCMEQKQPLGWSGHFIGDGVDLMLLYFYADNELRKGCKKVAERVADSLGFHTSRNLIFMKKNLLSETDIAMQNGDDIFWSTFCLWKENYPMTTDEIKPYVRWLEEVIDRRINGIVGGQYRNKYNDVAMLAAALGEVKESLGVENAKDMLINRYSGRYPRHSAFRSALKEYAD